MSTSPSFFWPQRVIAIGERLGLVSSEVGKRSAILMYNMCVRVFLFVFHMKLCVRFIQRNARC